MVLDIDDASAGLNMHRPFPDDLYLLVCSALLIIVQQRRHSTPQVRERCISCARDRVGYADSSGIERLGEANYFGELHVHFEKRCNLFIYNLEKYPK